MKDTYIEKWFSDEQRMQRELQVFFLYKLFGRNAELIFKGGTALDLFYGSGRFSEDLDFNCKNADVLVDVDEAIEALSNGEQYQIFNDWSRERELRKNFVRYNLRISSEKSRKLVNFIIDCSIGPTIYAPDNFVINYKDSLMNIKVMNAQEIVAEKVSALLTREKARDLYDLHFLVAVKHIPINMQDIYEKCGIKFSNKVPKKYSFKLFERRVKNLERRWSELEPLLNGYDDYTFAEISQDVLNLFRGL